jgi:hypothetical protein
MSAILLANTIVSADIFATMTALKLSLACVLTDELVMRHGMAKAFTLVTTRLKLLRALLQAAAVSGLEVFSVRSVRNATMLLAAQRETRAGLAGSPKTFEHSLNIAPHES